MTSTNIFLRRIPELLTGFVLTAGILMALFAWNFDQPPFNLSRLQQLQPGMSEADVESNLGTPSSRFPGSWVYSRPMAWPMVKIRFDNLGRFRESEYDY